IQTLVTPTKVITEKGRLTGLECIRNELGEPDSSGRRRPVPIKKTEHVIPLDTLIVAIGEDSGVDVISPAKSGGIETTQWNTVRADPTTLETNKPGVFAGGDVVRGPNTVVDAIADGKRAAVMIERYLKGEKLAQPSEARLPKVYVEPAKKKIDEETGDLVSRCETPRAPADWRKRNFAEVEVSFSVDEAAREACRCLRCDLEFTMKDNEDQAEQEANENQDSETRRQPA
ncbi:MAG: FAD-dependent oxidoreductase, partial [Planctomycetota bacterium]